MAEPSDIEQSEPRRVDSRGLPLAERPRSPLTEDEWAEARKKLGELIERMDSSPRSERRG